MRVALSVKNKLPLIDGTLAAPSNDDPFFAAWSRANNVVSLGYTTQFRKRL